YLHRVRERHFGYFDLQPNLLNRQRSERYALPRTSDSVRCALRVLSKRRLASNQFGRVPQPGHARIPLWDKQFSGSGPPEFATIQPAARFRRHPPATVSAGPPRPDSMPMSHSNSLLEDSPELLSHTGDETTERLISAAFEFLPNAVYLFGSDRRL